MKYTILQIPAEDRRDYKFMWFDYAINHGFDIDDYLRVYEGEIEPNERGPLATLEQLFFIFNVNQPEDFKGHSLSVSDIVILNGKYYYVDNIGYREIPESYLSGFNYEN